MKIYTLQELTMLNAQDMYKIASRLAEQTTLQPQAKELYIHLLLQAKKCCKKNKWVDENGVYVQISRREICRTLKTSPLKIANYQGQLQALQLIKIMPDGANPGKIYIGEGDELNRTRKVRIYI